MFTFLNTMPAWSLWRQLEKEIISLVLLKQKEKKLKSAWPPTDSTASKATLCGFYSSKEFQTFLFSLISLEFVLFLACHAHKSTATASASAVARLAGWLVAHGIARIDSIPCGCG